MEGSDRDREIESVMIVTTPPSKGMKSRKRKREIEELSSPSVDAVSEKNLRETAPMILARWKTAAYKSSSESRRIAEIVKEIDFSTSLVTEEDFKPQKEGGGHTCDGRSCVRIQSFQGEDLVTWFGDITEREKIEVQIMAECYTNTSVLIATALGFFSRMSSLQSLEMMESEHHLVTALSVESWPGALQTTQKHIRGWKIGLEAEMGFPVSEAYGLPVNAKSLVGSVMANLLGSHYLLHMAMVEVSGQRILVDKAFSVPKCVRLAQMSHHSHRLLRKILRTVTRAQRDDLSEIWGEELLSLGDKNSSDFEKQNAIGKPMNSVPAQEENDMTHEKMMELEPLLEASGERNLRNIEITHRECPCHCLAQTV